MAMTATAATTPMAALTPLLSPVDVVFGLTGLLIPAAASAARPVGVVI